MRSVGYQITETDSTFWILSMYYQNADARYWINDRPQSLTWLVRRYADFQAPLFAIHVQDDTRHVVGVLCCYSLSAWLRLCYSFKMHPFHLQHRLSQNND